MGAASRRPLLSAEGQRGYQGRSGLGILVTIERQREGVMLAFGNQEEEIR